MPSPFTPSKTDGAVDILRTIFGPVMDSVLTGDTATVATTGANMLGAAFGYFNSGVLFFGSLILMFVTVFGISNSANDGVALGKKWSTFYTPIRALVSAGSLIPTASGYAGIQLALLLIVTYSIGFASNMWEAVVSKSLSADIATEAVASVTSNPNFDAMVLNAIQMQICAQGVNDALKQTMPSANVALKLVQAGPYSMHPTANTTIESTSIYYSDPNFPAAKDICGALQFTSMVSADTSNSQTTTNVVQGVKAAILKVRTDFAKTFADPNGKVSALASSIIISIQNDGASPILASNIASQVMAMRKTVDADTLAAVTAEMHRTNESSVKKITDKGWIYAGAIYGEVARIKDAVRGATLSQNVDFTAGSNNLGGALTGQTQVAAQEILDRYATVASAVARKSLAIQSAEKPLRPVLPQIQTNFTAKDFASDGTGIFNRMKNFFSSPGQMVVTGVVSILSNPNSDPIMQIKDMGDYIAGFAELLLVTKAGIMTALKPLTAAVGEAGKSFFVSNLGTAAVIAITTALEAFITETFAMFSSGVYALLYAGYWMGIWIPMVPFYIFTLGVVGWLIFVVEMLAAGVLWMAAHTTPAREDSFVGSQTQGYLLVMSGFFRPALMILGLVASNSLMAPIITFVNESFKLKFMSLQADSVTGIMSVAGFLLIYTFIITSVIMLIFSLPQTLPDRILKWIGAGIGDMGEQNSAHKVEQSASSQSRQASMKGAQAATATRSAKEAQASRTAANEREDSRDAMQERLVSAVEGQSGQSTVRTSRSPNPDVEGA